MDAINAQLLGKWGTGGEFKVPVEKTTLSVENSGGFFVWERGYGFLENRVTRTPLEVGRRFSDPLHLESGWKKPF